MEFCTIRDIPQQTFINAANGKSTHPLPQILTVHLYHNGHTNGFRLVVILQSLIIPYDIRIDNILRTRFCQHKFRHWTGKERSLRNFYPHPAISIPRTDTDSDARLRITYIHGVYRHYDLSIGGSHWKDTGREYITAQLIRDIKARTERSRIQPDRADYH